MRIIKKLILAIILITGFMNISLSQVRCGLHCPDGAFVGCEGEYICEAYTDVGYVSCDGGMAQAFCD